MPLGKLTDLQQRVIVALAGLEPPWTLSGGAALVGFHTQHRETRDLDLFWQGRRVLDDLIDQTVRRLESQGFNVSIIQRAEAFGRLDVRDPAGSVIVDLVADPVPLAETPQLATVGETTVLVDTPHQILVNKLCALLSRSELRDLVDVRALLDAGGDLPRALADCPDQDGGFSPLTFSWAARGLAIGRLGRALGWSQAPVEDLERFRDELVDRILAAAKPD
ncbi:MAG TPA: nucleotidyl transferase AbiEii/AbiGii toxin family protein [Kofleriaceae bacterium]|nr:nucleotidyl transferase AbiEii/AbiGii toxin family protein [Kofleriaceae bacterium]